MKIRAPALLLCWLAALPAQGQSPSGIPTDPAATSRKAQMARLAQSKSEERFDAADEDKNGVLSRTEVASHFPFFDQNFERYDKDKDGTLSWEEFVGHSQWQRQIQKK